MGIKISGEVKVVMDFTMSFTELNIDTAKTEF